MTFRARILLLLAAVAVAPVLLLGWTSLRVNRDELFATVRAAQARAAADLASGCERTVLEAVRSLRLAGGYIPFDRLSPGDAAAVLAIPYRQLPAMTAVVLLDGRGAAIAGPVFDAAAADGASRREPLEPGELDAFARHVPLEAALRAGAAIGPPYHAPSGAPRLAVAVRVGGEPARVLAAQLSLAEVAERLGEVAAEGGRAWLVDGRGRLIADGSGRAALARGELDFVAAREPAGGAHAGMVRDGEERWLSAAAPVGQLGWTVVAAQPGSTALRVLERVRRYTLYWSGAALAVAASLGLVLARSVTRPVARLSAAAAAIQAGRYDGLGPEGGSDELGGLARAFDHMAAEVRRRDEEIHRWNAELQRRVEEKTHELQRAQDQVARARRLAALGSLGAGVAHALNNPMTSIVGLVSLVRQRVGPHTAEGELLGEALAEARRSTKVVQDLRRFADQEREGGGRPFVVDRPVRAALDGFRSRFAEHRIELVTEVARDLPPAQGHPEEIEQLVAHLVENAIAAMPQGGRLSLAVDALGKEAVRLRVTDTGCGIAPEARERIFDPFFTTRAGPGVGLGLSLSNGIVQAHHGSLSVESAPGHGACFTVVLPAAPAAPHLA